MSQSEFDPAALLFNGGKFRDMVYLNTAAEGLPLAACVEQVQRYLQDKSTGEPGRVPMWQTHTETRELAGRLFGVERDQVALLSSTTEALNTIANGIDWQDGDEVIFTSVEFPSNMFPWVVLPKHGVKTRIVSPRDGLVRIEDILEQINERTRLVTLSQVSYATGQQLNPDKLWERVKDTRTLLCVDATQAAGRVEVRGNKADFVVASTFKWLNSIHGAAILTVGPRPIESNVVGPAGWLSTVSCYAEDRLERFHPRPDAGRYHAGMPNFDSVYSLSASLRFHTPERVRQRPALLEPLIDKLRLGLVELGLTVLTPDKPADRAGIVAFNHPDSENIKRRLAEQSIFIHGDDKRVRATIHWYNTAEHVDRYLDALRKMKLS